MPLNHEMQSSMSTNPLNDVTVATTLTLFHPSRSARWELQSDAVGTGSVSDWMEVLRELIVGRSTPSRTDARGIE